MTSEDVALPTETVPERVLVIAAHPDDIDFGAAGTVATLTAKGATVAYCIVTDGDAGGFDRGIDRAEMPRIRRAEQTRAAELVGVHELTFLGYPDGRVLADLQLRTDLSRAIRQFRPDRVLCPSPERDYARLPASHPDHLATGEAALCAIYPDARNPFAFPELLAEGHEPHVVSEIWVMASKDQNIFVDITDTIGQKLAALAAHESQLPKPDETLAFVREWCASTAERAGFAPGRYAESFLKADAW